MKRYSYITLATILAAGFFTACEEEEGTAPGNDSQPRVTVYSFTPDDEQYDADNDVKVRVAANSKVQEIYYLAETSDAVESFIKANGENAYYDKVVSSGKKVDVKPAETGDIYVTGLYGQNTITFVAVNGSTHNAATVDFFGYTWTTISEGTYTFSEKATSRVGLEKVATSFQVCKDDAVTRYRFKDLYGIGKHLVMTDAELEQPVDGYSFVRIFAQATPFSYGSYGAINVRDLAEWQGDESYINIDYGCVIAENGSYAQIFVQYYVSAGSLGYGLDEYVAKKAE